MAHLMDEQTKLNLGGGRATFDASGNRTNGDAKEFNKARDAKVETMFSGSGVTPWHKLGKVIPGMATTEEALTLAGLNWRVEALPVQIQDEAWRTKDEVPAVALVRDSDRRVLGAAGTRYEVLQNDELYAIGEALVRSEGSEAQWETGGALFGGRRVWGLLSLDPESKAGVEVAPGDPVQCWLLLANAHDGSRAAEIMLTTVRVVCRNTMRAASTGNDTAMRFRHTASITEKMALAGKTLLTAREKQAEFLGALKGMARTRFTGEQQLTYLMAALGLDYKAEKGPMVRKVEDAVACLRWEQEHASNPDTVWTAFNAVTNYVNHAETAMRGESARDGTEKRVDAVVHGRLDQVQQSALQMALAVTGESTN